MVFWFCFTAWLPFELLRQTGRIRPDAFLVFAAYYALPAWVAGQVFRVPSIVFLRSLSRTTHSLVEFGSVVGWISSAWERLGLMGANRLVVMTGSMKRDLEAWIPSGRLPPIDILPNDIPTPYVSRPPNHSPPSRGLRVFAAGVLDKRKNIRVLLEAWELLEDLQEDCLLVIAGDGPEFGPLQEFVSSRHLKQVLFLGWSEEIADELQRADLLVHTALHEGMPNIVMEALSAGVPILLADIPELREMAGADDLLFPPRNPRALADQLHAFLTDSSRRDVLSKLSAEVAARYAFDWDTIAAQIVEQMRSPPVSE
jgi:glycosyltransferase involved in cell wall biosynthesis